VSYDPVPVRFLGFLVRLQIEGVGLPSSSDHGDSLRSFVRLPPLRVRKG